ncbi:Fimbrial protein [Caballeronia peredens]|nr:Fimbrial protein [Caballeronia peredens]
MSSSFLKLHIGRLVRCIVLFWLISLTHSAWAQQIGCVGGGGLDYPVNMPTDVTIAIDAVSTAPKLLTPWMKSITASPYTTCTYSGTVLSGYAVRPALTALDRTFTDSDRMTYTLWDIGVPGVGLAIGIYWTGYTFSFTLPVTSAGGTCSGCIGPPPSGWTGAGLILTGGSSTSRASEPQTIQARFALVATGDPITPGATTGRAVLLGQSYLDPGGVQSSPSAFSFSITSTNIHVPSCRVNPLTVQMGTHAPKEMPKGSPSTMTPVPVPISITNCPTTFGVNQIKYSISPTFGIAATNVAALDGSGAKGYGIQLYTSGGSVVPFNTLTDAGYVPGSSGLTINLNAKYYRYSDTVSSGSANSTMTVTVQYL